ncbi:DUF4012 domain-containing protein [Nocardioides panacisoli]|uniref:DUF4012 domain-containing protein n=1 Tax=Nocardioides panacisoli TaxID=627624 RepID=UPI0031D55713
MSPLVRRRRGPRSLWHRARTGLASRPVVLVSLVLGGILVLGILWCAFVGWRASSDLTEVRRDGEIMRDRLVDGDAAGAREALRNYQDAAAAAADRTDGPTWWTLEHLPVFGDDAQGIAVASSVLDDLGQQALPELVDAADQVTSRAFQPQGHRFPVSTITDAQEPAEKSEAAFADADRRLDAVDSSGFVGPVREGFDSLRSLVTTSRSTLGSVYRAARIMPDLLGANGPRHYLLVFENNAELRSTGGLAGSVSLLAADDGRVDIVDQEATHSFGNSRRSPVPLTREEEQLFGPALGQYFLDADLTPDVPRAAELMAGHWEKAYHQRVDGVFMIDPVAVSYLLAGTGPVPVPGYGPVTASTVVQLVENEIYKQTTSFAAHDAYQDAVAKAVFNAFADGRGDPVQLVTGLVRGVAEGRIRVHSFDKDVQQQISGTAIAGELPSEDPAVGVYLNDGTASKMSYYLRYDVHLVARSCTGDVQDLSGSIKLTNDTPPDIADYPWSVTGDKNRPDYWVTGEQQVVIYLMFPGDGQLESLEIDNRAINPPSTRPLEHRTVAPIYIDLQPEETSTVNFVLRTGHGQTGDVHLFVTPGSQPGSQSTTVSSHCSSQ